MVDAMGRRDVGSITLIQAVLILTLGGIIFFFIAPIRKSVTASDKRQNCLAQAEARGIDLANPGLNTEAVCPSD